MNLILDLTMCQPTKPALSVLTLLAQSGSRLRTQQRREAEPGSIFCVWAPLSELQIRCSYTPTAGRRLNNPCRRSLIKTGGHCDNPFRRGSGARIEGLALDRFARQLEVPQHDCGNAAAIESARSRPGLSERRRGRSEMSPSQSSHRGQLHPVDEVRRVLRMAGRGEDRAVISLSTSSQLAM